MPDKTDILVLSLSLIRQPQYWKKVLCSYLHIIFDALHYVHFMKYCVCIFVQIGGRFTSTTGLTLTHWGWSFLLAAGTIPVGVLMRFIPVEENPASFADYYGVDTTAHRRTSEVCLSPARR
jgi:hypothetical protein